MERHWFVASSDWKKRRQWRVWNNYLINLPHCEPKCGNGPKQAFSHMHWAAILMPIAPLRTATKVLPHCRIVFICVRCVVIMRNRQKDSRRVTSAPPHPPPIWRTSRGDLPDSIGISVLRVHLQLWLTRFRLVGHIENKWCQVKVKEQKKMPVLTWRKTVSPPLKL